MKLTSKKKLAILAIPLAILLSCDKKEVDLRPELSQKQMVSKTMDQKKSTKYVFNRVEINDVLDKELTLIALSFISISKDNNLRKFIAEKAEEKFDGENNVLLRDLTVDQSSFANDSDKRNNTNVESLFKNDSGISLSNALSKFKDMKGGPYYPHLFIPEGTKSERANSIYSTPVIIPFNGDDSNKQEVFFGFALDRDGKLIKNIPVDEEFSKKNEVWVITPNERLDKDGKLRDSYQVAKNSKAAGALASESGPLAKITSLTIKTHNESWIKGASEIEMKFLLSWENGMKPGGFTYEATYYKPVWGSFSLSTQSNGQLIWGDEDYNLFFGIFTRSEVKNQKPWTSPHIRYVEFPIYQHYFPDRGNILYYVIYEADAGGSEHIEYAPTRTGAFPMAVLDIPIVVRSDDPPYAMGSLKILTNSEVNYIEANTTFMWNTNNSGIHITGTQTTY